MRKRRADRWNEDDIAAIFRANTYGGNKMGIPRIGGVPVFTRNHPSMNRHGPAAGLSDEETRLEWDGVNRYPVGIEIKMTDGSWVRYRLAVDQPGYIPAEEIDRRTGCVRGYPREVRNE